MKKIFLATIILLSTLSISAYLFFNISEFKTENNMLWKKKELEIKSRLLSIPILLYHNIDGKGVFSIDLKTLRSHFQLLKERNVRVIKLSELNDRIENPVPFSEKAVVITFDDGFFSMYTKLLPLVKEFGFPVTLFIYTDAVSRRGGKGLDWDKLKILDRSGIDIQAHSKSHRDLTLLSRENTADSKAGLYQEIFLSKKILEMHLGKKVVFFAFPYGRYDLDLADLAYTAGYKRVFSTDYGSNIITRNNFCLRRQHIKRGFTLADIEKFIR